MQQSVNELIEQLNLVQHIEGGFFNEVYRSDYMIDTDRQDSQRHVMTSIYYLLTKEKPINYFAINQSDIMMYYHAGDPLKIIMISESGDVTEAILGMDLKAGQRPQIITPANCWKAYELLGDSYCLIGEAVAPGFEYQDMQMPDRLTFRNKYSQLEEQWGKYIR